MAGQVGTCSPRRGGGYVKQRVVKKLMVYALYKGETFLATGTARELAEERGVQRNTISYIGSNAYRSRLKEDHNALVAFPLGKEGEDV